MNEILRNSIVFRLIRDLEFKENGLYLIQGCCPACQKKELFTTIDAPWRLQCNRLNKCGQNFSIQELYPDFFDSWSDRYQISETDPNAAADAYLQNMRGFDLTPLAGCYRQESYYCPATGQGSATVRFEIADGVWWERIIDNPHRFDRKANFHGNYRGLWWFPAAQKQQMPETKEIWITEGIFDAIALQHCGIAAVSVLSCNNYPDIALNKLKENNRMPHLVVAFDNDKAGKKATLKFIERAKSEGWRVAAALPCEGKKKTDWNDLHLLNKLNRDDLDSYRYFGDLLTAPTAADKAVLIYSRQRKSEFWFEYRKKIWWGKINTEKAEAVAETQGANIHDTDVIRQSMTVSEICNCFPKALYYQINELTREVMYFFQIEKSFENTTYLEFNNYQLGNASDFKKHLLRDKGALFTGTSTQLDAIIREQLPDIRTVKTVDFIGYSNEYQAYIFNDVAIKKGKIYPLNSERFFEIGKLNIKSTAKSIKLNLDASIKPNTDWVNLLWQAFGEKGMVALAFWFGSAFAEQIRGLYNSFPFLEINGDPGTGKSTLLETLWKLFGRDYEGFDPQKATLAGRSRTFSQVANLPVVLIEGDRDEGAKQRKFEFDELKSLYDGNCTHTRGVRNGGNETYEPPFRGTICIAQNAAVNASEALLQRIVQICTDRKYHNTHTREAAQQLLRLEVVELSGFLLQVVMKEREVMHLIKEKVPEYEAQLGQYTEITTYRIIKNHALILALLDALCLVTPLQKHWIESTRQEAIKMALERQQAINMDHPLVMQFWEIFDYLTGMGIPLNHSKDKNIIAVNLNHFVQMASEYRQALAPTADLKRILKNSIKKKFLGAKQIRSIINETHNKHVVGNKRSETLHCWLFTAG